VTGASRLDLLVELLLDESAGGEERDDAAMDLGDFDDLVAIEALLRVGSDPDEPEYLRSTAGGSLAEIWVRTGEFQPAQLNELMADAFAEAIALLRKKRPDWLE
jgi:HEAT repeat protein